MRPGPCSISSFTLGPPIGRCAPGRGPRDFRAGLIVDRPSDRLTSWARGSETELPRWPRLGDQWSWNDTKVISAQ